MEQLPPDIIMETLMKAEPADISRACQSSRLINDLICRDEYFWRLKYERDYGDRKLVPGLSSWKERYSQAYDPCYPGQKYNYNRVYCIDKAIKTKDISRFRYYYYSLGDSLAPGIDLLDATLQLDVVDVFVDVISKTTMLKLNQLLNKVSKYYAPNIETLIQDNLNSYLEAYGLNYDTLMRMWKGEYVDDETVFAAYAIIFGESKALHLFHNYEGQFQVIETVADKDNSSMNYRDRRKDILQNAISKIVDKISNIYAYFIFEDVNTN